MNPTCLTSAIWGLQSLIQNSPSTSPMENQVHILYMEFHFLDLYIWCLMKWNEAVLDKKNKLESVKKSHIKAAMGSAVKGFYDTAIKALDRGEFKDLDGLVSGLLEKVQQCKPKIQKDCVDWLDSSFECKFSSYDLRGFASYLSNSLAEFIRFKGDMTGGLNMQTEGIKRKIDLVVSIFDFAPRKKDLKDFKILIQSWALKAVCLCLLYWVIADVKEEKLAARMSIYSGDLEQKIRHLIPQIIWMSLSIIKRQWFAHSLIDEFVPKFVDFVLDILQVAGLKDGIQKLHSRLRFLLTFFADPQLQEYKEDAIFILNKVESLICSLGTKELNEGFAEERKCFLDDFLEKINMVEAEVRKLYSHMFLDSSSFNFPRTNVLGFIDSLVEKLKDISVCFANHQVRIIEEEFLSVQPFLKYILDQQNEHEGLNDLGTRIINVAHRVELVLNLILYRNDFGQYDKCLSDVADEIKLVKIEAEKIQDQHINIVEVPVAKMNSSLVFPSQAKMSRLVDEVVVGLDDESETIVTRLTRGSKQLGIVSIFGMPGIGKSTLAKKVYNNPSVQYHFNKCAWCCVSQTYQRKDLLLHILSHFIRFKEIPKVQEEDLAEQLYKCLKGHRYLIVLDDIWDIRAWEALKLSFPDDNNGSRIMFTSRIDNVGLQAKPDCSSYPLHALSDEKSWELLQKKLYSEDICAPNFAEIGKKIARNCNGLPLALVVTAGLLSEKVDNLNWWIEIANSLGSRIANEGCIDIVDLSYKHLPEFLKPCFLYFGAFLEGTEIKVQKLTELWISEGFITKSESKNLEDVAMDYLMDLVARSLVMVTKRSPTGGIKVCHVHDLLRQFCLAKGKEENFLLTKRLNHPSLRAVYKHYRICIETAWNAFFFSYPLGPCVHSLLIKPYDAPYSCGLDHFCLSGFKLLQVLDLEDLIFPGNIAAEVVELVLLRYLAMQCSTAFTIPTSIENLRNLETFRFKIRLRSEEVLRLPYTIWTMKWLRHLDVGTCKSSFSDESQLEESSQLENVQTFSLASLSFATDAEKLLQRLPRVRKLKCEFRDTRDPKERENEVPVLDFRSQLESLNVLYNGKVLYPCAFNFPSTLKNLTLAKFKLPWSEISMMGQLPNLEVLKLLKDAFYGERWDMVDEEFLKLKFLKLSGLNIAEWNGSDNPFPWLEQLIVERCFQLEEIPLSFGEIPTLKTIHVHGCSSDLATSVRNIQEEQLGMGNEDLEFFVMTDFQDMTDGWMDTSPFQD